MNFALLGGLLGFATFAWNMVAWLNSHVQLHTELRESWADEHPDLLLSIENSGSSVRRIAYAGLLLGPDGFSLWDMLRDVASEATPAGTRPGLLGRVGMPDADENDVLRAVYAASARATNGSVHTGSQGVHLLTLPYFFRDQTTIGQGELVQYPVALDPDWVAKAAEPLRMYFFILIKYPFAQMRIRSTAELLVPAGGKDQDVVRTR